MGPLTGNIYHPPAFRGRMALKDRLRERLHVAAQWLLGRVFADKRRASVVLVSGFFANARAISSSTLIGVPAGKHQHCGVALESASKNLSALHT